MKKQYLLLMLGFISSQMNVVDAAQSPRSVTQNLETLEKSFNDLSVKPDEIEQVKECSICLESENLVTLRCNHHFHSSCLYKLGATAQDHSNKCPLCRSLLKKADSKYSILMHAQNNSIKKLKKALKHGADSNASNQDGNTALMIASFLGFEGLVKLLLSEKNIDVKASNQDGNTALILASFRGFEGLVKLLLGKKNINVNASNQDGNTALIVACANGHQAIVEMLLSGTNNINVNATNKDGSTALMFACANGYQEIVRLLLEQKNINRHAVNKYGKMAPDFAIDKHDNILYLFNDTQDDTMIHHVKKNNPRRIERWVSFSFLVMFFLATTTIPKN